MQRPAFKYFGLASWALLFASTAAHAAIFNVTPTTGGNCAADPNSCTLQEALIEASKNQQADTINLAAGTYDASKNVLNNISVPFAYTAQVGPDENFPLEIVGTGDGNTIVTGADIQQGFLIATGNLTDDSAANVTIKGITLQNTVLAATVITKSAEVNYENNIQRQNKQGISLISEDGGFNVVGNTFQDEQVVNGYISVKLNSSNGGAVQIQDNIFRDNGAADVESGGFVVEKSGPVVFSGNTLQNNELAYLVYIADSSGLKILDNVFLGNQPAFALMYGITLGDAEFSRNILTNNRGNSQFTAVIQSPAGSIVADSNRLVGNAAGYILYTPAKKEVTLTNNLVFQNNAAIVAVGASTEEGDLFFVNNTVVANNVYQAGAVYFGVESETASARLYNNIVSDNLGLAGDVFVNDDADGDDMASSVIASHNIFSTFNTACLEDDMDACAGKVTQTANLELDPLFVDPSVGDFHLAGGSPAIGAGDPGAPSLPAVDLDGVARSTPPDIGALQAVSNLSVDPTSVNFGNVSIEVPNARIVTLTNRGGLDLAVTSLSVDDTTHYALDLSQGDKPCGSATPTVKAGESCTFEILFQPQAEGTLDANLTVASNDPDSGSFLIPLTGVGVDEDPATSDGGCSLGAQGQASAWLGLGLLPFLTAAWRRSKKS